MSGGTAAIVTVGTELLEGLRLDTNTRDVALALSPRGFSVAETVSVGDDVDVLARTLKRLCAVHDLVVTTGGLGPTHDDITAESAASALGLPLVRNEKMAEFLLPFQARHKDPIAAEQVMLQAMVIEGAEILFPATGTAPGQVACTRAGLLVLLPGPPSEMSEMLARFTGRYPVTRSTPRELGVAGLSESDAQVRAQRGLAGLDGVRLTVLSRPGDVRIILMDEGAGDEGLEAVVANVAAELGEYCYSTAGESLAESVVGSLIRTHTTVAVAESCTGGMLASALTDVPGASATFLGGVVAYSNSAKVRLLGVPDEVIATHGAVSKMTALSMADNARRALGADIAVAITGIAGPEGGTAEKPVGLVWFAVASRDSSNAMEHQFPATSRAAIRQRATATGLDLIRRHIPS